MIPLYGIDGKPKGEVQPGTAFATPVRQDLIQRAVLAERARQRQPYGVDPLAGKRTSAHYHGLRHYRNTMMNREMARMPRIHGTGALHFTARFVPQATKGRKAHPPKAEKDWTLKINKKERLLALRSALAATAQARPAGTLAFPIVVEDRLLQISKTRELLAFLAALGIPLLRERSVRAGRGKSRGRRYRTPKGPLLVVHAKPAHALGVETVAVKDLQVSHLAPGGQPGRRCIFTETSFKQAGELGGEA
ncbi:MAG: 50S ribosomal protein L4 [Candidatus Aenigmarchaeota archaeon]|nr:50S ribosomal protein L4 [Candidatus Aenigmarchaeota archaeon]